MAKNLEAAIQKRKDTDAQLIKLLEPEKKAAKDHEDSWSINHRLSKELILLRASLVDKKNLDEQLQKAFEKLTEMEPIVRQMVRTDVELVEAKKPIALLEKAANPLVKVLVPEDPARLTSFLDRLKAVPRQLKAFIRKSSEACTVHALAVIKSRYPEVDIAKCAGGAEQGCTEETFKGMKKEAEPVVQTISQSLKL